jgi:hypothetical protein
MCIAIWKYCNIILQIFYRIFVTFTTRTFIYINLRLIYAMTQNLLRTSTCEGDYKRRVNLKEGFVVFLSLEISLHFNSTSPRQLTQRLWASTFPLVFSLFLQPFLAWIKYVHYSKLLHRLPLGFHCVWGMLGLNPGLLQLWHYALTTFNDSQKRCLFCIYYWSMSYMDAVGSTVEWFTKGIYLQKQVEAFCC